MQTKWITGCHIRKRLHSKIQIGQSGLHQSSASRGKDNFQFSPFQFNIQSNM